MIQFPNTLIADNYERHHILENQIRDRESNLDLKVHLELSSLNFCSEQVQHQC